MKREEVIFEQALALSSAEAREANLLGVCGDDRGPRQRVQGLLAARQDAGERDGIGIPSATQPFAVVQKTKTISSTLSRFCEL